ncbi:MAG: SPFH domain-containing protein [Lachnospiraceae bacterium]|nr:SPFH domain-containing protein [Lachnospiraceae bacterium]
MGLIKAIVGAAGGVMADQWKEYFYCDAIPEDVLITKGVCRTSGRSSNTKGEDNIISNGSVIAVADGQCMLIVEQGKVVDICAEPGEYTYDMSTEPSLFYGSLSKSIPAVFKNIGQRFTFGGGAGKDQRVYYVNTKEIMGNKYGTPSPVPFRVVDERAGIDMDIGIKCFGEYSYRITNPILFYTKVAGNVQSEYKRSEIDSQLKTELLTALQPAFYKVGCQGVRYTALTGATMEMATALNDVLSSNWGDIRGIEVVSFGISSVTPDEEDEKTIKEMQKTAAYTDPTRLAAYMGMSQAEAAKAAAANTSAGPAMAFMGMGMANQAAGMGPNINGLFQMGQQQQQQQQQAAQPQAAPAQNAAADSWQCACGATVTGKFCTECGAKKPEAVAGWTCSCGAVNKGKFCAECGAKKPEGVPQYQCDKCGWEPEDPQNPPKFCPECGDPFDAGDIK